MKKRTHKRITSLACAIKEHPFASWFIVYCAWLIDLASTALVLGIYPETFSEANPIAAYFFTFGIIGWVIWAAVVVLVLFLVLKLPEVYLFTINWSKKRADKKKKKEYKKFIDLYYPILRIFIFFGLICSESIVITHNYYIFFRHIFML